MPTNQCTCLASFPTIDLLEEHLQDIQTQRDYHSAQVQRCRRHRKVDDNHSNHPGDATPNHRPRICPFKGCLREKEFSTKQHLDRHFETHIECNEVCVFCIKKSFLLVSEFVRHAKQHSDEEDSIKLGYMNAICERLKDKSAKQLREAKLHSMHTAQEAGSMKRSQDAAGLDQPTAGAKRTVRAHPLQNNFQAVDDVPAAPTVLPFVACMTNEMPLHMHSFRDTQPSLMDDVFTPQLVKEHPIPMNQIDPQWLLEMGSWGPQS